MFFWPDMDNMCSIVPKKVEFLMPAIFTQKFKSGVLLEFLWLVDVQM